MILNNLYLVAPNVTSIPYCLILCVKIIFNTLYVIKHPNTANNIAITFSFDTICSTICAKVLSSSDAA